MLSESALKLIGAIFDSNQVGVTTSVSKTVVEIQNWVESQLKAREDAK